MKVGTTVNARATRTGVLTAGRFVGRTRIAGSPGEWLKVNHAPKGKAPAIKHYRTAQVTPLA